LQARTPGQVGGLAVYGAVQMALPYWLVARGLRSVSPQEAGTLTLLEPLLNPLWAYAVSGETPHDFTLFGGVFILGALVWRYWPRGPVAVPKLPSHSLVDERRSLSPPSAPPA